MHELDRDLQWSTLWNNHSNTVAVHVYEVDESRKRTIIGSIIEMEGERYTSPELAGFLAKLDFHIREEVERRIAENIAKAHQSREREL